MTPERMIGIKVQSTTAVGSEKRIVYVVQRILSGFPNERMLSKAQSRRLKSNERQLDNEGIRGLTCEYICKARD